MLHEHASGLNRRYKRERTIAGRKYLTVAPNILCVVNMELAIISDR
jgi:hypothetical protein